MNLSTPTTATTIDPVCGMTVDPDHSAGRSTYAGSDPGILLAVVQS